MTEFGVNAIVLPPGIDTGPHMHERQQELYFVHSGRIEIEFGDGLEYELGPGGLARVDAPTVRTIRNHGPEDAVYVVVGAEERLRRPRRPAAGGRRRPPRQIDPHGE